MPVKRTWLTDLRKSHGMTLEQVSRELRVSLRNVARWERGESEPRIHHRLALARLLGVEVLHRFAEDTLAAFDADARQAS